MVETNTALNSYQADEDLPIGTVLAEGQFTVTDSLGAGGFSVTYRASDTVLGRPVVIKECFPADCCDRDGKNVVARNSTQGKQLRSIVDMFMREARALAKLRHPNIVGVHRAFEENETAYMVLDLIDGQDLLEILDTQSVKLSPARVKDILMQMLDAIEKVHDSDLLHRDISPDNIILEKSGTPVLIDFGAARSDASRRTRAISALLVVKDGYSPQEFYVAGSLQTPSSDLYALGATFYHVLSGVAPPSSQARMLEVAGKRPDPCVPLSGRIEGYDPAFLKAIDMAMELHQSERLQSAAQWRNMIIETVETSLEPLSVPSARPPSQTISLDLERSLTRLVEETNDEVRKTKAVEVKSEPKVVEPEKPVLPEWVEEFNRDSLEQLEAEAQANDAELEEAESSTEEDQAPIGLAPSREDSGETDWVNRAIEKQQRVREESLQMLGVPSPPVVEEKEAPRKRRGSEALPAIAPAPEPRPKKKKGSGFKTVLIYTILIIAACMLLFLGTVSALKGIS